MGGRDALNVLGREDAAFGHQQGAHGAKHRQAFGDFQIHFEGAQRTVVHPDQIAPINAAFTPDAAEVDKARRFVAAYREAAARGEAVALVDGEFIAMDLVPRMERIIALSEEAAAI